MLKEINNFPSKSKASIVATMVGAYDTTTGKTSVGRSNASISREALHPETVYFLESSLGVKVGEFTSFCKNKTGACAEISAADKLIRNGSNPNNIDFTEAVRTKDV